MKGILMDLTHWFQVSITTIFVVLLGIAGWVLSLAIRVARLCQWKELIDQNRQDDKEQHRSISEKINRIDRVTFALAQKAGINVDFDSH